MTVKLADSFIASDQTGAFPRVSNRGNKYICVFYIYDANYIKGLAIKSRHRSELLGAYKKVYKWCEYGSSQNCIEWTTKHQAT